MKRGKVIVQANSAVGYWELTPIESGAGLLAPHDTSTFRVTKVRLAAKKQSNSWWTEKNWTRLKKALVNSLYPYVRGQCGESCLELGLDPVPKKTVFNVLQSIDRNPITYDNSFPMKKRSFLSERDVNYVGGFIVKRDTSNIGMSRKELIKVTSELSQEKLFVKAENHLEYLIRSKQLTQLKGLGRVVTPQ